MEKIYVLDTNVLLHDPMAIYAFAEHKVVIPMTVLEELDEIKDRRDKAIIPTIICFSFVHNLFDYHCLFLVLI